MFVNLPLTLLDVVRLLSQEVGVRHDVAGSRCLVEDDVLDFHAVRMEHDVLCMHAHTVTDDVTHGNTATEHAAQVRRNQQSLTHVVLTCSEWHGGDCCARVAAVVLPEPLVHTFPGATVSTSTQPALPPLLAYPSAVAASSAV